MFFKTIKLKKIYIIFFISVLLVIFLLILLYQTVFADDESSNKDDDYIKWIDFNATEQILSDTSKLDIQSHNENYDVKYNWIELLAYLSSKYYGNLDSYKKADLNKLVEELNSRKNDGRIISKYG